MAVPPHPKYRISGRRTIATFHTHPNMGDVYRQEPGQVDIRAVKGDFDLKDGDYMGEFVVSQDWVYLIEQSGQVAPVGSTKDILGERRRL